MSSAAAGALGRRGGWTAAAAATGRRATKYDSSSRRAWHAVTGFGSGSRRQSSSAAHVQEHDHHHQYVSSQHDPSSSSSSSSSTATTTTSSTSASPSAQVSRRYGQPLPSSHPHLFPQRHSLLGGAGLVPPNDAGYRPVAEDELTPGIPAAEYEERRRKLMERLPEGSVVVCMGGRIKSMSGNIFYRFRQDSNFLYLTGFQEPDSAAILSKQASSPRGYKMTMLVQPREEANEVWNGPRTGIDGASSLFGADEALAMEPGTFLNHLKQILPAFTHIYVDPPPTPTLPRQPSRRTPSILNFLSPPSPTAYDNFPRKADFDMVVKLLGDTRKCHSLTKEVHALRLYKSENELRLMRRAGQVGSTAMMEAMRKASPGCSEWKLQSVFEASCALEGAQRPAYVPVVASGRNALTIHYVQNDSLCGPTDLVCMDAGCELDGYVSDITRAFPVAGRFSGAQRDLYGAVLSVLKACTKLATESQGYTLSGLHRRSVEMLAAELRRLGFTLPAGSLERDIYPHALSHWLGIDLHDTSTVDRNTMLRSGMCLSVEPAVYCQEGMQGVPPAFWGLGIRIEDDVALWESDNNVVLNAECPREIADVEAVCSGFWDPAERNADDGAYATDAGLRHAMSP